MEEEEEEEEDSLSEEGAAPAAAEEEEEEECSPAETPRAASQNCFICSINGDSRGSDTFSTTTETEENKFGFEDSDTPSCMMSKIKLC